MCVMGTTHLVTWRLLCGCEGKLLVGPHEAHLPVFMTLCTALHFESVLSPETWLGQWGSARLPKQRPDKDVYTGLAFLEHAADKKSWISVCRSHKQDNQGSPADTRLTARHVSKAILDPLAPAEVLSDHSHMNDFDEPSRTTR